MKPPAFTRFRIDAGREPDMATSQSCRAGSASSIGGRAGHHLRSRRWRERHRVCCGSAARRQSVDRRTVHSDQRYHPQRHRAAERRRLARFGLYLEPDGRDAYTSLRVEADKLITTDQLTRTMCGLVLVQAPPFADFRYGDRVRAEGKLDTPTDSGDFSYRDHLARQEVYSIIPKSVQDAFRTTGTSHVSAISGYNVTILVWLSSQRQCDHSVIGQWGTAMTRRRKNNRRSVSAPERQLFILTPVVSVCTGSPRPDAPGRYRHSPRGRQLSVRF